VSEPLARLYDLALRALDDHERRIDALRSRLAPTLAAAALGVTLLSGPLVGGARPVTFAGKLALVAAVSGRLVVIGAAFRLLSAHRHPVPDIDPERLAGDFARSGLLEDEMAFYRAMLMKLSERRNEAADAIVQLAQAFTAMLWGILVMLCGLALVALIG
jgi:hypothetical protein